MHPSLLGFADYPFPLTLQTRVFVMAALLWAKMQTMTLSDILATGGASHGPWPEIGLALTPTFDADGHLIDINARVATRSKSRASPSIRWSVSVPVTGNEASFLEEVADRVEREWLKIEIDLRMRRVGRELGSIAGAELLRAREEVGRLCRTPWRLASCRHLWVLSEALRQELATRGNEEPSLHKRFEHARACEGLSKETRAEVAKARVWHEKTPAHMRPWGIDLKPITDDDTRHLVLHRAAQAEARTKKALAAARKEVKRLAGGVAGVSAR